MNAKWGIGALAYSSGRQSHMDVFWASMLLIGIIGFALDKSGALAGRKMYKYKFLKKGE
jgi:ABC-type nitrate/sulfonate/bicarbonate transport system permease component